MGVKSRVGSNPTPSTILIQCGFFRFGCIGGHGRYGCPYEHGLACRV